MDSPGNLPKSSLVYQPLLFILSKIAAFPIHMSISLSPTFFRFSILVNARPFPHLLFHHFSTPTPVP
jgi:hypothetical protein